MDIVSILVVALLGALALFFLAPRSKEPAAPAAASKPAKKPKAPKKPKARRAPAPAPEPEPEPEPEPAAAASPKKPSKKQRQKAAARAKKAAEAKKLAEETAAAKKAAKKKARNAKKAGGAAAAAVAAAVADDADVAAALAAEEQQASWEDDDSDVGEWEDVASIRKAKKQAQKQKSAGEAKYGNGPTIKKTIDVGKSIPALMGRGGENVKAIREATGVDIKIPRREENSTVVTVIGSADGVTAALELINDRINGGGSGSPRHDDRDSETITIEESDVRLVIGRGGATIKLIEGECGASLRVSKEGTPTVVIRGDQDQIASAKLLIAKVIAGRGILNGVRETLALADGQARVVIGPKGSTINGIKDASGAQLKVTDAQVEIFGTPDQVKAAAAAVGALLADYGTFTMDVDPRQCGTIIGSGGATIIKLQRDSGASINVDSNSRTVSISGTSKAIAKARAAITAVLEAPRTFSPLADGVASEIMDLGASVSRVIGRRGATVQKIQSDTGAKLDFIDQTARISGTDEQVAAAKEAVQAILDAEAKRAAAQERAAKERAAKAAAAAEAGGADAEEDAEDQLGEDDLDDAAGW